MMEEKLPKGWKLVLLKNIASVQSGGTPSRGISKYWGGDIPWVKISDIKSLNVFQTDEFITHLGLKNSSTRVFPKGTILFTIFASIGKVGVLQIDAATNQAIAGITPSSEIDKKFLTFSLLNLSNKIQESGKGVAQNNINLSILRETLIPLPPLPEQQRIVAKLDALFGHLDRLREKLDRIPELLKNFRQQVLTQAVTGELTKEWRKRKLEVNRLSFKNKFDIEFELFDYNMIPDSWVYTALGNFASCSRGKFTIRPRNDPRYFNGKYPFIQIGDLPKDGGEVQSYSKTLNELGKTVSKEFPKGTVVIAIVGATIGNTGILKRDMFFPDSLIGINTTNLISNQFIDLFLRAIKFNLRQFSYAGGGQPNIKLNNIQNLGIALPSIEEQEEIIGKINELFSLTDKIESQYLSLKAKIDQLPQAILAKAFRGELVEQESVKGCEVEKGDTMMEKVYKTDYKN